MDDQVADSSPARDNDGGEWQSQLIDVVEDVVSAVHDRIVRPLVVAARGVVFGIVVATMALIMGLLLSIGVVRVLTVYAFGNRAWASDAVVGAVLTAGGVLAWSKRRPRQGVSEP